MPDLQTLQLLSYVSIGLFTAIVACVGICLLTPLSRKRAGKLAAFTFMVTGFVTLSSGFLYLWHHWWR